MITEAISILRPNSTFGLKNNDYSTLKWNDTNTDPPSLEEVESKIAELTAAEPLRLLRQQRNRLLTETDWMAVADRTMTQAQIDYRQALRDLPATADPQLDENGNLTNVTWPSYE